MKLTRQKICSDLRSLGVTTSDVLFLHSDLSGFTKLDGKPRDVILGGILDALGPDGTLVCPAFTKKYPFWKRNVPLSELAKARPTTGALANILMRHEKVIRSLHPTHSVFALGARADEIIAGHDESKSAFEPLRMVIRSNGIQMVMGCTTNTPGMPSIHLAQYDLGLSQQHFMKYLFRARFLSDSGEIINYKLSESPGCSRGFGKQYDAYVKDENLSTGYVGPAWTVVTRAKLAYEKDMATLKDNPNYLRCDNSECMSCSLRNYNKRSIPGMVYANVMKRFTAEK